MKQSKAYMAAIRKAAKLTPEHDAFNVKMLAKKLNENELVVADDIRVTRNVTAWVKEVRK